MSLVGVTTRDMSWRDEDGRPRFPALPIRPSRIVHDSNEIVDLLVAQRVHSPHPAEVLSVRAFALARPGDHARRAERVRGSRGEAGRIDRPRASRYPKHLRILQLRPSLQSP